MVEGLTSLSKKKRVLYQGALFDMDGLLIDSERVCLIAFEDTANGFGLPAMRGVALACIGLRADAVKEKVSHALAGRVDYAAFHDDWGRRVATSFARGIPLKAGVVELLEILKAQRIPCAVATSTRTDSAEAHLQKAGLRSYFAAVIGGDQVVKGKPSPDIYHKAAAVLTVETSSCAAFEDSDPGTLAAIASGAVVVQVPDVNPPSADMHLKGHIIAPTLIAGAQQIGLI